MLVAGDTKFRAGAIEQLDVWAKRVGVPIVSSQQNKDPSSVCFMMVLKSALKGKYWMFLFVIVLVDFKQKLI